MDCLRFISYCVVLSLLLAGVSGCHKNKNRAVEPSQIQGPLADFSSLESELSTATFAGKSLKGFVVDWQGALIVNAEVVAKPVQSHRETHGQLKTVTNGHGLYGLDLKPGNYVITIHFGGFKPWRRKVTIKSDGAIELNALLQVVPQS